MNYFDALILALIEGITEFLPISSTGHLTLAATLLNIEHTEFVKSFEIIIQLGAIAAVIFLYWGSLLTNFSILKKVFVAFLPTAFLGFLLYGFIKSTLLGNEQVVVASLFIGGILLILLELFYKEKTHHISSLENISYTNALLIGLFQSASMVPGVSRAAATIVGALLLGTKRTAAVEFSFLLAIPTMLAATILDIYKANFSFTSHEYSLLAVGFLGSFIVAIVSIKFFLQFIKSHTFIPFGIYRIVIALLFFLFILQ